MSTSLSNKHAEPMVIRKYTRPFGFPCYVALITGDDLNDLDEVVNKYNEQWPEQKRGLQDLRNYFGGMTEMLVEHYPRAEGIAVCSFADKAVISSLWGDFMVHGQCRLEYFSLLNMTTQV